MNQGKNSKPIDQEEPRIKLDSLLRDGRLKTVDPDIGDVWEELNNINKQEEKAFNDKVEKIKNKLSKVKVKVPSKIKFKKQPKTLKKSNFKFKKLFQKKIVRAGLVVALAFASLGIIKSLVTDKDTPNQLGVSTDSANASSGNIEADIPQVQTTEFPLIWPNGKSEKDFKIVRLNPFGNDTVYTYVDALNGLEIRISQQELPDNFGSSQDEKLKELADSFQATNIIQIDEQKTYHGYSETTNTQSLIFIKKDLLIFIASPQQTSDEVWAGYISALQ